MIISIIAAIGKNRELGKDNKLLWNIPEDMKRFRELTSGHVVIMGRKTFESIGKPLQNRTNIIISRNPKSETLNSKQIQNSKSQIDSLLIASSLDKAFDLARGLVKNDKEEVFVIGGGQIYQQAIKLADKLYLTLVDKEFEADTFFPDYSEFSKIIFEKIGESNGLKYKFLEIVKG